MSGDGCDLGLRTFRDGKPSYCSAAQVIEGDAFYAGGNPGLAE
jgi:hypothetical protein